MAIAVRIILARHVQRGENRSHRSDLPLAILDFAMSKQAPAMRDNIRRRSWLLQSIVIRQTARKAFDLTRLGTGPWERLCSALILGAAFFLPTLFVFWLIGLGPIIGGSLAVAALFTVLATCAILVLWSSDEDLEKERVRVKAELDALREDAAIEKTQRQAAGAAAEEEFDFSAPRPVHQVRPIAVPPPSAPAAPATWRCPYCKETIIAGAVKCKHCGEILHAGIRSSRRQWARHGSPGVAAVLSFLIPGLGQMYKGEVLAGLAWFLMVTFAYVLCFIPGIFMHVICIFHAASGDV